MLLQRLLLPAVAALLGAVAAPTTPPSPTTVIRGASLIDGTGAPARTADVRIVAGRVTQVGAIATRPGDRVVEARGLVLAPGFIDSHSHHDRRLADHRDALAAVS